MGKPVQFLLPERTEYRCNLFPSFKASVYPMCYMESTGIG